MRVIFYNKSLKRNLDSQVAKNLDSPHVLSLFSIVSYVTLLANYSDIVMLKFWKDFEIPCFGRFAHISTFN